MTLIFLFCIHLLAAPFPQPTSTFCESIHAIYLSVVRIEHREASGEAQLLVKVFTDDLRDVIRSGYPEQYAPAAEDLFCSLNRTSIQQYFQDKLQINVNGHPARLSLLEGQRENEVYWLSFRLEGPERWREVAVTASFFMEIFSTQSNIIQLINGDEKRFARLTRTARLAEFSF